MLLKRIWTLVGRAGFRAGDTDSIWQKYVGSTYIQHASEDALEALLEALPAELEELRKQRDEWFRESEKIHAARMSNIASIATEHGHQVGREGNFIVCSRCGAAWSSEWSQSLKQQCTGRHPIASRAS